MPKGGQEDGANIGREETLAKSPFQQLVAPVTALLKAEGLCCSPGECAPDLARSIVSAGSEAARFWEGWPHRQQVREQEWKLWREIPIRANLVFAAAERNVTKLGRKHEAEAVRRAKRHWDRRLLAKDYVRAGVPERAPKRRHRPWEETVADALVRALQQVLGRPLRNPRTVAATSEIEVLVKAFRIVRAPWRLKLKRGKQVRDPGSPHWFRSRVETLRRRQKA
jgi:hypothetical protein